MTVVAIEDLDVVIGEIRVDTEEVDGASEVGIYRHELGFGYLCLIMARQEVRNFRSPLQARRWLGI